VLSEIYQYAWSLGLKTTYYLRTLGASRVEKSTVSMAKFGTTSKADGSNSSVASPVIVEEMVVVRSQSGLEASIEPAITGAMSPMTSGEVAAIIEAKQVMAGQMDLLEMAKKAPVVAATPVVYESKGVPTFGEKAVAPPVAAGQKRIEIIGEACESCSA
jgi:ribonucleotide reductase alpha subunit